MKDLHALRARLRQAGMKPASELEKPRPKPALLPADWPGRAVPGPDGIFYLAEYRYGPEIRQGDLGLLDFLPFSPLPDFLEIPRDTNLARMVFMDTETTGLAGGTGTLAFLIGTGTCIEGTFVVRQYFLPDPSGEAGMLEAALTEMENGAGLVTFNGRGFDVPILQARAALRLRRFGSLEQSPHWDLLPRPPIVEAQVGILRAAFPRDRSARRAPVHRGRTQQHDPLALPGIFAHRRPAFDRGGAVPQRPGCPVDGVPRSAHP
jgi:hypothetical protein